MMNGVVGIDSDGSEFVEVDPTGRYVRYNEILGKGASKTVYKAFDEYEGIEVAWNQVKLYDFLQTPDDLERLYCEIHLLKTLKHKNIMKFFTSWVDTANRNINFVTEMFTSGTLRQYRMKHKRVNIRAIKHWCRQILQGLHNLHTNDPPIIHRDLKCDNIFINGNQGEVKIGDLGLAAILRKPHAAHCVGTPEFMAPEVYEEEYNELVDIYSFGMCILEMVTFEYPYSECSHPAQIYKKVTSGKKPDALYKIKDSEVRQFVEKCLASASDRLSAWELLNDPFLQTNDYVCDLSSYYQHDYNERGSILNHQLLSNHHSTSSSLVNGYGNFLGHELENEFDSHLVEYEEKEIDLFTCQDDNHLGNVDVTIKGPRREDDNIFLRLRIADKEGRVRNIYFPFDIETDTALSVAVEMVAELDITDQDVMKIAEMIDGEIASLVPNWKRGDDVEENLELGDDGGACCHSCSLNGSPATYLSSQKSGKNLQVLQCSKHGCGAVHGRFEEITYQFEGSKQCVANDPPMGSTNHSGDLPFTDIWAQHEGGPEINSLLDNDDHFIDKPRSSNQLITSKDDTCDIPRLYTASDSSLPKDYENEIRREMRWLKAKYQMQLGKLRDQQLCIVSKDNLKSLSSIWEDGNGVEQNGSLAFSGHCNASAHSYRPMCDSFHRLNMGVSGPSLHRATSLPVDATDT